MEMAYFYIGTFVVVPVVAALITMAHAYEDSHPFPHWREEL